jgi:uncharacterized membrane protein
MRERRQGAAMKTTMLGGILFLAPLVVLAIILEKAFEISVRVAAVIGKVIPVDGFIGAFSVNLLAVALLLLICYLAGLAARLAFLSRRLKRLDGLLIDFIPTYAVFKTVVTSASARDDLDALMTPVVVRFDDHERVAFEIERDDAQSVVFLPGSPSAWSGETAVVDLARLRYLDMPAHGAVRLLRTFGRGSLDAKARARSGP